MRQLNGVYTQKIDNPLDIWLITGCILEFITIQTYFEETFTRLITNGKSVNEALLEVTDLYLAGKPIQEKQKKTSNHHQFWFSDFLWDTSLVDLKSEPFVLAIAKYFSQADTSNFILLERFTKKSPWLSVKAYDVLK